MKRYDMRVPVLLTAVAALLAGLIVANVQPRVLAQVVGSAVNTGGAASAAFSALTGGTNTAAAMVIGSGASLTTSGTGTISGAAAELYSPPGCLQAQALTRFAQFAHFATTNCGATETTGASTTLPSDYAQQLLTRSGTVKNLYCAIDTAINADTETMTVRTGTAGSGSNTAVTCQITGAGVTTCSDTTHTAASTAGQYTSLQIVSSATAGTRGVVCAWENAF